MSVAKITKEAAKKLGQEFLCKSIEIEHCPSPPHGLYGFDANKEYLFTFRLFGHASVGSSEYIAVSIATGAVRYVGHHGE